MASEKSSLLGTPPPPPPMAPAPTAYVSHVIRFEEWGDGLFGCDKDLFSCLFAWCCPCIVSGHLFEAAREGPLELGALLWLGVCCIGCAPCYDVWLRDRLLRMAGRATTDTLCDFASFCCCHPCALSQDYRAVNHPTAAQHFVVQHQPR